MKNQGTKKSGTAHKSTALKPDGLAPRATTILALKDRLVTVARAAVGVSLLMFVVAGGAFDGGVASVGQIASLCGLGLLAGLVGFLVIKIEEALA